MMFTPGVARARNILIYVCAFTLIFISLVSFFVSTSSSWRKTSNINDVPTRRVALVLGTSPWTVDGEANQYFAARMNGAAELYFSGKVDRLLVSGDNRTDHYNEPIKMKNALVALGVPQEDIILDYAGRDTLDSVLRTRDIFGVTDPVIVTQRFHADRAVVMAEWNGMDAVAFIVPDGARRDVRLKLAVREVLARIKMLLELVLGRNMHIPGEYEPIE